MAYDKIVDSTALDSALTDIADAIRTKTGGTDPLTVTQMPSEIESISGGGADHSVEDAIITRSITGVYENDRITTVGKSAFYACQSLEAVNLGACVEVLDSAFFRCTRLKTVNAPLVSIGASAFFESGLKTIESSRITSLGDGCFQSTNSLVSISLPLVTTVPDSCLRGSAIQSVDLGAATSIARTAFTDSASLETLIIRTETLCTIADASVALRGSKIASGTGYIYVPDNLVDSYKAATNWVALANQIKPISALEAST